MYQVEECQSYLERARSEHRQVERALREAESQLLSGFHTELLRKLRGQVARHFAVEEQGGCLEEAVSRNPSLSHEIIELEHQHPGLLAELDALIESLERGGDTKAFGQEFIGFAARLREHEEQENRVLERGFNVSLER